MENSAVGTGQLGPELIDHTEVKSCEGKAATPGLIADCHTHLVYGGSREHEFAKKLAGVSYLLSRSAGLEHGLGDTGSFFDNLYDKSKRLLDYMLRHGDTVEAKSGYGLIGKLKNVSWMLWLH